MRVSPLVILDATVSMRGWTDNGTHGRASGLQYFDADIWHVFILYCLMAVQFEAWIFFRRLREDVVHASEAGCVLAETMVGDLERR